jgi:glutamine cyclotransferase
MQPKPQTNPKRPAKDFSKGNYMPANGNFFPVLLLSVLVSIFSGCGRNPVNSNGKGSKASPGQISGPNRTRIIQPENDQMFTIGEVVIALVDKVADTVQHIDSVEFYFGGSKIHACHEEPYRYEFNTGDQPVGTLSIRTVTWLADSLREYHNLQITLLSDVIPENLPYRIVNIYPHDIKAYTQGLIFEDGFLYEGTGQYKESSLRKVEIKNGEPIRLTLLADEIFGEGITIFNGRIYQLTYKSQVGFVYDKESFKRIQKVYYQNKEGWGLTQDRTHLIMSDGSHRIYYMDPEYFTEIRQMEVYDNKGAVTRLNELEYIEGKIFANIYGKEEIVIIDPETGKVTGKLNMRGLLDQVDKHSRIDVFNGIAWNPDRRMLYVTGKYWPSLFEISIGEGF